MKNIINKKELQVLYSEKQFTMKEISEHFNVSTRKINKLLGFYEIPKRENQGLKPIQRVQFSERQMQIVRGTLLGDGFLSFPAKRSTNATLEVTHSLKQEEYLNWKVNELQPFVTKVDKNLVKGRFIADHYTKDLISIRMRTVSHPNLNNLVYEYYPNGKKLISIELLNKIDELGLAVWYMDDGHTYHGSRLEIALGECGEHVAEIICNWFLSRWKIKSGYRYTRGGYRCFFNVENSKKLVSLIYPHFVQSMLFKIQKLI